MVWGCAALAAGATVYFTDRSALDIYLLPNALAQMQIMTLDFHDSIPSFLHAFAFCLITAGALGLSEVSDTNVCLSWLCIDALLEIGQHQAVSFSLAAALPAWVAEVPLLQALPGYLMQGTFDSFDIMFTACGCLCAFLFLKIMRAD